MRKFLTVITAVLAVSAITACGRSHNGSSASATNSNAPTAVEQQVAFYSTQFIKPIFMHIPADDYAGVQVLAAQNGPLDWDTFIRSNIGCVQQGYAATGSSHPPPSVDGYSFSGDALEADLEQGGLRRVQSYTLTLNPTPWGSISRSFQCLVNTDALQAMSGGQDLHGEISLQLGHRVCSRWTYANQYQNAIPGQGTVQVFAGTFTYSIESIVDGASFPGQGTASVKMYLNPDNGQWTVTDFQMQDPQLSLSTIRGHKEPQPTQATCAGP